MVIEMHGRSGLIRRICTGVVVIVTSTVLLAGCAEGQHVATVDQRPAIDGVRADNGVLGIRAAGITAPTGSNQSYPSGTDAALQFILVNNGTTEDKLVSVSTDAAQAASLSAGTVPEAGSASASASNSSEPAGAPSAPITVPAGSAVQVGFDNNGPAVVLTALTKALFPSDSVAITFAFASGAQIATHLAVKLTTGDRTIPTLPVAPSEAN